MESSTAHIPTLSLRDLRRADRTLAMPFKVELTDSEIPLICDEVVRIVPGKRVVLFGTWGDKSVVTKLFYDAHHAERNVKRELAGINALTTNAVLTPALYYQETSSNKHIHILIFERIQEAKSLDVLWQERASIKEMMPLMQAMTIELATHHVLGILQHDLHLKNFLVRGTNIYTIDGGDIEVSNSPISKKDSIDNLGLFFSQLGIGTEELQKVLFQIYARSRAWSIKQEDIAQLETSLQAWTKKRLENYRKKVMRTCSAFLRRKNFNSVTVYDRDYKSAAFSSVLKNPDAILSAGETVLLKEGRSSTVAKIDIDGKPFVLKRYNIKNLGHRLRRALRETRAASGWRLAQRLRLLGIPTAKPVAFIEKRFLGLRGKSYLLMEYVEGLDAGHFFESNERTTQNSLFTVHQIMALFENLARLRITHGDLKMTNILISQQKPVLIDLDGMCQHRTLFGFRRAFQKEIERFMQNWRDVPMVAAMFEQLVADMYKRLGVKA